jgi:RNA polymerase sigma-70 factor (ECF subfamily)
MVTPSLNLAFALRLPPPSLAGETRLARMTKRMRQGEEEAFREFHALYFGRLHRFLLAVTRGNEIQAQEALQETFLRVARHGRVFTNDDVFWWWLKAVARNAARDAARQRRRYDSLLEKFFRRETQDSAPEVSWAPLLEESLAELDPEERSLVESKYLDGESVRQLSAQAGLTEKSVESRLLRLRRRLRARILEKLKVP